VVFGENFALPGTLNFLFISTYVYFGTVTSLFAGSITAREWLRLQD